MAKAVFACSASIVNILFPVPSRQSEEQANIMVNSSSLVAIPLVEVGMVMDEEKKENEEQGLKIRAYFNVSPKLAAELWRWSKAAFVVLLTAGSVSNYLGIKITRQAVENNKNSVLVLQSDIDACKATQKENLMLRKSFDELVDVVKRLMPAIKNPTLRRQSQEKVKEIEQRIKPLSMADPLRADNPIHPM